MSDHHNDPQLQGQGQGQLEGQLQGQLQGELQGQGQLQGELQGQGQGQLQGQGQGQGQGQAQSQSSDSWNGNGNLNGNFNANGSLNGNGNFNGNGNLNGNGNFNANANYNADANYNANTNSNTVTVDVTVDANVTPANIYGLDMSNMFNNIYNGDGAILFMPQAITQSIDATGADGSVNTEIAIDQVNSLVSNGYLGMATVDNSGHFDGNSVGAGPATAGIGDHASIGDLASGGMTSNATAQATMDAFTQSIVMGANIQLNNFNTSVIGHDSITTTSVGSVADTHHH
jgi:hypothetical protein